MAGLRARSPQKHNEHEGLKKANGRLACLVIIQHAESGLLGDLEDHRLLGDLAHRQVHAGGVALAQFAHPTYQDEMRKMSTRDRECQCGNVPRKRKSFMGLPRIIAGAHRMKSSIVHLSPGLLLLIAGGH